MINLLSNVLSRVGGLFKYLSNKIYKSPLQLEKGRFVKHIGNSTNLLSFLNENSVVFDIGGYEGQWASDIYSMYNCNIHIFEPVPNFYKKIEEKFNKNSKIKTNPFGLSNKTETTEISLSANGSSTVKNVSDEKILIKLIDIVEYIQKNNLSHIDLIKINIEGGEYALLNRLIDSGIINKISNILVQFHDFFPEAEREMQKIQNKLSKSHKPVYQYKFIWELWSKI